MATPQFPSEGGNVQMDDPFPIEKFRRSVRDAVLAEFGGRCPSVQEVVSIPDAEWLAVPSIGPATLAEFHQVMKSGPYDAKVRAFSGWTDAALMAERNRLQQDLHGLRDELLSRRYKLAAITAELRRRGMASPRRGARAAAMERTDPTHVNGAGPEPRDR